MKKAVLLILLFISYQHYSFGQNKVYDSLETIINNEKYDTAKVEKIHDLTIIYFLQNNNFTDALTYAERGLALAEKNKYKTGIVKLTILIGIIYGDESKESKQLDYFILALQRAEKFGNNELTDFCLLQLAGFYADNPKKSLSFNLQRLRNNDKKLLDGIEFLYLSLARCYNNLNNQDSSLYFYTKASAIFKAKKDYRQYGPLLEANSDIADKLIKNKRYTEALDMLNETITFCNKNNDDYKNEESYALISIGEIYFTLNKDNEGWEYLFKALTLAENWKEPVNLSSINSLISTHYVKEKKLNKALEYAKQSLKYAKESKLLRFIADSEKSLSDIYFKMNDGINALEHYKKYTETKDSMNTEENIKKLTRTEMNFEFSKKQAADSIKLEAEKKIIDSKFEKEKTQRYALYGGLAFMILLTGISYRNFKRKQKDNVIITEQKHVVEQQKEIVEEKQREILDSIEYALRIQTAILPPTRIVKQYLENSFILYKPKDIVAGDFYWMEQVQLADDSISLLANEENKHNASSSHQLINPSTNQLILFAACDCTGHGVPGAMVSVVCHNALNRAVREFGLTQPAAILDKTAEIVIENFSKSEEDIKDGMDISLVSLKYSSQNSKIEIEWAGANNPLWILRNTSSTLDTRPLSLLEETKADKQPIGMNEDSKPFTNHSFILNTGDTVYLFTDGFADQFGGETGEKKLTRKRFKELLLSIQNKPMPEQCITLDSFIVDYRKQVEQIDDILVMGVRV